MDSEKKLATIKHFAREARIRHQSVAPKAQFSPEERSRQ